MSPDPIWSPAAERVTASRLHRFSQQHRPGAADYRALHDWSITEPADFWAATADYTGLELSAPPTSIVRDFDCMPGARWFEGARLNYAANLLRGDVDRTAIVFVNELGERRERTLHELRARVSALAGALTELGVGAGDRVAGILPNTPECVEAALAAASIGAVWSSCSPDFGPASLLDRLRQVEPKILFGVDACSFKGRLIDCTRTLTDVAHQLPSVTHVVRSRYPGAPETPVPPGMLDLDDLIARAASVNYRDVAFDDPLFILFSSGTTGPPKCIVHGTGGTLLQHLKEHQLHTDIGSRDVVFYYTTTGWMMWNWLLSALASQATIVLYDGAPFHPDPSALWRLAAAEGITVFGTSARYLNALEKSGQEPKREFGLDRLRAVLSTGSPLAPSSFDFVYRAIKADLMLASIAGGTDIISCFVLGNPMLPVYRGEIQCAGLGMDVRIFDSEGRELHERQGELVCASPFPSMPVAFWNDADGRAYRRAYFERYPGVWHHGDFAEITATGGIVMYGRSDATLNPGGVRIGTAEIYRVLEDMPDIADCVVVGQDWDSDTRIVLFVQLADGRQPDAALEQRIRQLIRTHASPRHVPARIVHVSDVPRTLSGKVSERAVRDAIHGRHVGNENALANPESLGQFTNRPELAS